MSDAALCSQVATLWRLLIILDLISMHNTDRIGSPITERSAVVHSLLLPDTVAAAAAAVYVVTSTVNCWRPNILIVPDDGRSD